MVQPLGVAGTSGGVATRRRRGLQQFYFGGRFLRVRGSQTKAADKNGKAKVRRLAKLTIEKRDESRRQKHDGKNLAFLEFSKAEQAELHGEQSSPEQVGESKDRP